jgi:hypothetical protein
VTYVDLPWERHRPVQVQHDDGTWCDGWLEAYRQVDAVWSAFVRYSTKPGVNYLGWFEEPRIRGH